MQLDEDLPPVKTDENLPVQLDLWWAMVFKSGKYPALSLIVKAFCQFFLGHTLKPRLAE